MSNDNMSNDDDDVPVFYTDARDGLLTSAADARRKALKHFDYFLVGYCKQIGMGVVRGEDIPYHGIPQKPTEKEVFKFWDDLFGAFVTYLGKHARAGCNPRGPPIGRSTAAGYCSAVKNYFTDVFRAETPIPVFQKLPFRKLTDKLQGMFRESNQATGKFETEDVSSTRRDRESISTACIWMGTPEFAEFWHLSNSSYHCCGRGSETSLIKADGVVSVEINEMVYRYDVIAVQLQRQKNGPFQTLPIYPHRDGLLEDFYFSLIHLIIVKGCDHEYVLPQFASAALKMKKSGESSSDVSRQWSNFFEGIRSTFEILADEINEELGSHSNRRGGNQALAENPSVHGFAAIYRSGIKPKNLATIFDYLFGSSELLRQAGKGLAGWVTKNDEYVMGGQPVTFDDVTEDVESLRKFTAIIFEDDTKGRWHPRVRELLVMTLLLRYDEFIAILQSHPFSKLVETHPDADVNERYSCSSVEDNIFVNRINQALERVCDDDQNVMDVDQNDEFVMDVTPTPNDLFLSNRMRMFTRWIREARKAFASNNHAGLPISNLRFYGVDPVSTGVLMDTRTLIDHFNLLASVAQSNHMELQRQRHILNDLQQAFNVESRITSTHVVERLFNMERSLRRLEENLLPEAPKPEPTPSKGVIFFSVSSKCLITCASQHRCKQDVPAIYPSSHILSFLDASGPDTLE